MPELAPESIGLCDRCKGQNEFHYGNFDFLASEELPRSHRISIGLGTLTELVRRRNECSFCSLVVSAISTAWKRPPESLLEEGSNIECSLCNRVVGVIENQESNVSYSENFRDNQYRYANCRLEVECKPAPPNCPSKIEIQAIDSRANVRGLFDDAPLFTRRPCQKMHTIDFGLLRNWLRHCNDKHGNFCSPDKIENATTDAYLKYFRLIDVTTKRIVNAKPSYEYVALSYVWGRPPFLRLVHSNKSELCIEGALNSNNEHVPKTIQDAIQAVERLNLQYLWVDALCIMQDDLAEKAQVIGAMDLIYSRASLTIVAASGSHANAGLPGLELGSRNLSSFEAMAKFPESSREFLVARPSPTYSIQRSPWNTRGWTYQERLCSHRLLVFTEDQVLYLCAKALWCEDTVLETDDPRVQYEERPLFSLNMPNDETLSFMQNVGQEGTASAVQEYGKMVDEYMSRNLTFAGDILDAFKGGLNRFQGNWRRKGTDLTCIFGLPSSWFELGLLWNPEPESPKWERRSEKWQYSPGTKIPFPSWSWMGWTCKTKARVMEIEEVALRPEVDWYYVEPGSNSITRLVGSTKFPSPPHWFKISDDPQTLRDQWKPCDAPSVVTEADLSQFNSADLAGKLVFFTSACFLPLTRNVDKYLGRVNAFTIGSGRSDIFLNPEWAQERIGQSFEFIVFGRYLRNTQNISETEDQLYVMLVERKEGIAYRVGVGRIAESDWVKAKPTWQLVVLG